MPLWKLNTSIASPSATGLVIKGVAYNAGLGQGMMWTETGTGYIWYWVDWGGPGPPDSDFYGHLVNLSTGQSWLVPGPSFSTGVLGLRGICYSPTYNKVYAGSSYGDNRYAVEFDFNNRTFKIITDTPFDNLYYGPGLGDDGGIHFFSAANVYAYYPTSSTLNKIAKNYSSGFNASVAADDAYQYLIEFDGTYQHVYSRLLPSGSWAEWSNGVSDIILNTFGQFFKCSDGGVWYLSFLQSGVWNYYSVSENIFTLIGTSEPCDLAHTYQRPECGHISWVPVWESQYFGSGYDLDVAYVLPVENVQEYSKIGYRTPTGSGDYTYVQVSYSGPWTDFDPGFICPHEDGNEFEGLSNSGYTPMGLINYGVQTLTSQPPLNLSNYFSLHIFGTSLDILLGYPNGIYIYDYTQPWTLNSNITGRYLPTDSGKPNPYNANYGSENLDYRGQSDYDFNNVLYIGGNIATDGRIAGLGTHGDVGARDPNTGAFTYLFPQWGGFDIPNTPRANPTVFTVANHNLLNGDTLYPYGITQAGWSANNNTAYIITVIDVNHFSLPIDSTGYAADYNSSDPGQLLPGINFRHLCANKDRTKICVCSNTGMIFIIDAATLTVDLEPIGPVPSTGSNIYMLAMNDGSIMGVSLNATFSQYYIINFNPLTKAVNFLYGPYAYSGWPFGFGDNAYSRMLYKPVLGPDGYYWLFMGNNLRRISLLGILETVKACGTYGQITFCNGGQDIMVSNNGTLKRIQNLLVAYGRLVSGISAGTINGNNSHVINGVEIN